MELTICRVANPTRSGLRMGWSQDRAEFDAVKEIIKDTLGRSWDGTAKLWEVPTDHLRGVALRLMKAGHTIGIEDEVYAQELAARRKQLDRVGELAFLMDVEDFAVPPTIKTQPRGYQKVAAMMLGSIPGGSLLADPVGTGKTLEAILDHELNGYRTGPNSILWIVPSPLRFNVRSQYKIHMGLTDDEVDELVTVIDGPKKKRAEQWKRPTAIKVVGYEMLFHHDWSNPDVPQEWNKIYADEVMKVKNRRSIINRRMKALRAAHGITGMTATPVEMRLTETYELFEVLRPGLLGLFWQFSERFLLTDWRGQVVGANPSGMAEFADLVAPYMIKRRKEQLMPQLPPKQRITIDVELSEREQRQYRQIADDFMNWLIQTGSSSSADPLTQLLRLLQYCGSPNIVNPLYPVVGAKMNALMDIVEEHRDDSIVIFTQWTSTGERLFRELRDELGAGTTVLYAHGGTSAREKQEISDRINARQERIILVSTDSMSHGFDMYGAHVMVHYDALWNPAKMIEQREGRLHRGDQREQVTVYTLRTLNTFEVVKQDVMEKRSQLAETVYDGAESVMLRRWNKRQWQQALAGELVEEAS